MKIGIVGTGIAGLSAGWLLSRAGHEVTLFEKLSDFGLSGHRVPLESLQGPIDVDVPSRMFNASQWPNLVRLYDLLSVAYEPVDLSKSFFRSDLNPFLRLDSSYQPQSRLAALNAKVRTIGSESERLMKIVTSSSTMGQDESFDKFLARNEFKPEFVYDFLFPMLSSTVCTCSYSALNDMPASTILNTLVRITGPNLSDTRQLMRTSLGSADVSKRLAKPIHEVQFEITVKNVSQTNAGVKVSFVSSGKEGERDFDHVIVATQANQAATFVQDASLELNKALSSFKYESVETIVHTDETQLPEKRQDWSQFNFSIDDSGSACHVWMNRYLPKSDFNHQVFQTIMPVSEPASENVLARRRLQRPILELKSQSNIDGLRRVMSQQKTSRRIWFTGSYAGNGVPLLESAVEASLFVCSLLDVEVPADFKRAETIAAT